MNTNNSHLTAIHRKAMSAPLQFLLKNKMVKGRILDYGCGHGTDCKFLSKLGYIAVGYDSYYKPQKPRGKYDTILCTYVLNVLKDKDRKEVINDIYTLLSENGNAYITVRRDIHEPTLSAKGTFQDLVILDLPIIKETSKYCIYRLL